MHYLILLIILLLFIFLPQYWVKYVLNKYNQNDETNFTGTGGELARHLRAPAGHHVLALDTREPAPAAADPRGQARGAARR